MSKFKNAIAAFKVGLADFRERERFSGAVPEYVRVAKTFPKKSDTFEAEVMRNFIKDTDSRIAVERLQMAKEGIDYDKIKLAEKALVSGDENESK